MVSEGKVRERRDVFPGERTIIFIWNEGIEPREMRFDLIPRFFQRNLSLAEMLKEKRSKRKGGHGFDSYNARSESILEKASFRSPWAEGKRMVVPVEAWRERPNMDEAPKEFKGREFQIHLSEPKNLAGIYDTWRNKEGETLESFAIITVDSLGNNLLRGIWHERCPLVLESSQVEEWLDPTTPPEAALRMFRLLAASEMRLEEITRKSKGDPQQSLF